MKQNSYKILEVIDKNESSLINRTASLSDIRGLGPPDMCCIKREFTPTGLKKFVSKSYTQTCYHYIYGTNTSSVGSIACYFRKFIDNYKAKNTKITFGCFCVYDLISKYDLRVEIHIPGNTSAYLINAEGECFQAEETHWLGGYISSILRTLYPQRGSVVATMGIFKSIEEIEEIMTIAEKFWSEFGFVLGDVNDTVKYGVNLLFPAIGNYLLKMRKYKIHQVLFKKYIEKDPLMLTFLAKSSLKIGKLDEIIRLLGNQIKITPHAFPLYFSMAKAYLKRKDLPQAIKLCQYLVELNLEIYDYWHLLIVCYIRSKDYISAILCLNLIPHYAIVEEKYDLEVSENYIILPEKVSFRSAGNIWITPTELDFREFEDQVSVKSNKEKEILKKFNTMRGTKFSGSKIRAYKLLVKMEKIIEWENLIKIKQSILKRTTPVQLEEEKIQTQNISSIGPASEANKSGFSRVVFSTFSHDFQSEIDPYIDE